MEKTDLKNKCVRVYDFGMATEIAVTLAKKFGRVEFFSPWAAAFPKFATSLTGKDADSIHRIDYFFEGKDDVDLFVFPDTYCKDIAKDLREEGRRVWSPFNIEVLENNRWECKKLMKKIGLPIQPKGHKCIKIVGVEKLISYMKEHDDLVIKINLFRGDCECVDDKTEILTDKGWLYFRELNLEEDKVLSMDLNTRDAEFVPINHYFESYYEGKMFEITGRSINLLVTPKHKFFVKSNYTLKKWQYLPIEKIKDWFSYRLPSTCLVNGQEPEIFTVPSVLSPTHKYIEKNVKMESWLTFLGWFLSEGSLDRPKNKYRISIAQSKKVHPEKWQEIKDILDILGYNYNIEMEVGFSIYNKALYYCLADSCYEGDIYRCNTKKIPDYVFLLSPNFKKILLDTFLRGDRCREGKYSRYYTTSPLLADGLQVLLLMSGNGASISKRKRKEEWNVEYSISSRKTKDILLNKNSIKETYYKGFIYDVNVEPFHSILVRRNGKVCWTGNTFKHTKWNVTMAQHMGELLHKVGITENEIEFVVEEKIDGVEPGYDGFNIDGIFSRQCMYGYESDNAGYIGKICLDSQLPKIMQDVNKKLSPYFKKAKARTFFSTEMRVQNKIGYLIDFTLRCPMPAPTSVHLEIWSNLAEFIWEGAGGNLIDLRPTARYGAGAVIKSEWAKDHWTNIEINPEDRRWVKLRMFRMKENLYWIIPGLYRVATIVGLGNSPEECIKKIEDVASRVKLADKDFHIDDLQSLINKDIPNGIKEGINF